jgi:hypothetical protein
MDVSAGTSTRVALNCVTRGKYGEPCTVCVLVTDLTISMLLFRVQCVDSRRGDAKYHVGWQKAGFAGKRNVIYLSSG